MAVRVRSARSLTAGAVALTALLTVGIAVEAAPKTKRVSLTSGGKQRIGVQLDPSMSANGRFVAFRSSAPLTPGANGDSQIYVRDRQKGKTKRVSRSSAGVVAVGVSWRPSISANGRFVAFESSAVNLIGGDGNGSSDIFVHDRKKKKTKRVSIRSDGSERVGDSLEPSISANGRFVAFSSEAPLVASDSNGTFDIYVRDRKKGKTRRVSITSGGGQATDGSGSAAISATGRFVAFSSSEPFVGGDTNGVSDVYIRDRKKKTTKRISNGFKGAEPNGTSIGPSISPSGRFVVFTSSAENLIGNDDNNEHDVFIRDRRKKRTKRVSLSKFGQPDGGSFAGPVSADGRFVFFETATKLVPVDDNGDFDVYLRDRKKGKTKLLSRDRFGGEGNGDSRSPAISADGGFVAFDSHASDLVKKDTNASSDIFVRGPLR